MDHNMTEPTKKVNVGALAGITLGALAVVVALVIWAFQPSKGDAEVPAKEVRWTDLRQYDFKAHKGPDWLMAMNDKPVKIAGYVVPMESKPITKEFVFVPDQLACVHVPPPPPNLMIYVHTEKEVKLEELTGPQWLYGTLHIMDTDSPFGQISYIVKSNKIEPYRL
jgi:hypothetical protein